MPLTLSSQLTFPALFALFTSKLMPERFHVVGVGRQPAAGKPPQTAQGLREHLCSNAGTSKAAGSDFLFLSASKRVTVTVTVFATVSGPGTDEFFAKCCAPSPPRVLY